jgi:hypothetical protein
MRKLNGIPRQHFNLFLKECEWRFNIGAPSKLLVGLKSLLKESYQVSTHYFFIGLNMNERLAATNSYNGFS